MATRIRLKEWEPKSPFYRLVVADSRAPRDGRFIEELVIMIRLKTYGNKY